MAYCPKCKGQMNPTQLACPHCGYDFPISDFRERGKPNILATLFEWLSRAAQWRRRIIWAYTVRSLMLFSLFVPSAGALWYHWKPCYCINPRDRDFVELEASRRWWEPPGSYWVPGDPGLAWRYRRPSKWWGVFYLKEFWTTVLFGSFLVWSLWRDQKYFRTVEARTAAERAEKLARSALDARVKAKLAAEREAKSGGGPGASGPPREESPPDSPKRP